MLKIDAGNTHIARALSSPKTYYYEKETDMEKRNAILAPRWLRTRDAAARLGLSETTFRDWIRAGRLPQGKKAGANVTVWDIRELDAAYEAMLTPAQ